MLRRRKIFEERKCIFLQRRRKGGKEKEEIFGEKKDFGSSQCGAVLSGSWWNWVSTGRHWFIHEAIGSVKGRNWLVLRDTGSVQGVTGCFLVVLGQYRAVLIDI